MRALTQPLEELAIWEELVKSSNREGVTDLEGCIESVRPQIIASLGSKCRFNVILAVDEQRARQLVDNLGIFGGKAVYYPPRDLIFYQSDVNGNELAQQRVSACQALYSGEERIFFVTTIDALMEKCLGPSHIGDHALHIRESDSIKLDKVSRKLGELGYERVSQVEGAGQFAVRGGIMDVFPMGSDNPYRIELWGDDIDSLKEFDVYSQRSIERVESVDIYPAMEYVLDEDRRARGSGRIRRELEERYNKLREEMKTKESFRLKTGVEEFLEELEQAPAMANIAGFAPFFFDDLDSLMSSFDPDETMVFLDEVSRLDDRAKSVTEEFETSMESRYEEGQSLLRAGEFIFSPEEVYGFFRNYRVVSLNTILTRHDMYTSGASFTISPVSISSYNKSLSALIHDLEAYRRKHYRVVIFSGSKTRARRLADDINQYDIPAVFTENLDRKLEKGEVLTAYGNVSRGYEYPELNFAVISETDIFGARKESRRRRGSRKKSITDFKDLHVGDFCIHENYGVGRYDGIERIEVDGVSRDFIKLSYAGARGQGESAVYVLASNLDAVQKYASRDADKKPKLNQLGGKEWSRTRARVKKSVETIARNLVELYALRQKSQGYVYGPDTVWQREFEELFPFDETDDQLEAIADVKRDMESGKIMDRLICGDVGFGKTEVAIRAAFKAVQESRQVALLTPTTILAQQHFNTLTQRLKDFPVRVDLLCRFRSRKEQNKTISDLKNGLVDIVVGTHRLLSKDVVFKDLGLLIIDEEQRFGVAHKEKIKEMRRNVDVLALTATPIPRTLHMSLTGIRDMSTLEQAPQDRIPIQTFVMERTDEMVREAVKREMARSGQVYYVFNRINGIELVASDIRKMVPEANVAFAHGRMNERQLEDIMSDFINGDIDVLVSTTIIETGLDIPNVNTIIVDNADRMGLSQLYQLRGRVGRSNRTAYAFLMYDRNRILKEEAEKRLSAIKEFSRLGSGMNIALKDLEIRGAGNVLGEAQHGHMEAVGYDLYCKMLDTAVKLEKGEKAAPDFTTTIQLPVNAFISDKYVRNENQRLDLYKRIAVISSRDEAADMRDELFDRFGDLPESMSNLIDIALLKNMAHEVCVESVSGDTESLRFNIFSGAKLNPANIPGLLESFDGALTLHPKDKPFFSYRLSRRENEGMLPAAMKVVEGMKVLLEDEAEGGY